MLLRDCLFACVILCVMKAHGKWSKLQSVVQLHVVSLQMIWLPGRNTLES